MNTAALSVCLMSNYDAGTVPNCAALCSPAVTSSTLSSTGALPTGAIALFPVGAAGLLGAAGLWKDRVLLLEAITFMSGSRPTSLNILPAQHVTGPSQLPAALDPRFHSPAHRMQVSPCRLCKT